MRVTFRPYVALWNGAVDPTQEDAACHELLCLWPEPCVLRQDPQPGGGQLASLQVEQLSNVPLFITLDNSVPLDSGQQHEWHEDPSPAGHVNVGVGGKQ